MDNNNHSQDQSLEVKTSSGSKIIYHRNILFIKAEKKFSIVHLDDETVITYHSLKWFQNYLKKPVFFRCHNSFIVNCQFVENYNRREIKLKNHDKIPLSRIRLWILIENLRSLKDQH